MKKTLVYTLEENRKYFEMTPEMQRFHFYRGTITKIGVEANYVEKDDKLYYSQCEMHLHFNNKLYYRYQNKKGFTFDKKTGKVTIWFKGDIASMGHVSKLLVALGHEWVVNEKVYLMGLTKTQLERILNGKMTNPIDFCKHFIRYNRIKTLSPETLRKWIKSSNPDNTFNKFTVLHAAGLYSNVDHYFELKWGTTSQHHVTLTDMGIQAKQLGYKINPRWSEARMEEEHIKWSRELMELELSTLEEKVYTDEDNLPPLPKGYSFITTRTELFREGSEMHHCIYTNYENRIDMGEYIAVAYKHKDHRATIGMKMSFIQNSKKDMEPRVVIEQIQGKRNKHIPDDVRAQISKDILENEKVNNWFLEYFITKKKFRKVIRNKTFTEPAFIDYVQGPRVLEFNNEPVMAHNAVDFDL